MTEFVRPKRYSEITPEHVWGLTLSASLEKAYPHWQPKPGERRPSEILAGYREWQLKRWRTTGDAA